MAPDAVATTAVTVPGLKFCQKFPDDLSRPRSTSSRSHLVVMTKVFLPSTHNVEQDDVGDYLASIHDQYGAVIAPDQYLCFSHVNNCKLEQRDLIVGTEMGWKPPALLGKLQDHQCSTAIIDFGNRIHRNSQSLRPLTIGCRKAAHWPGVMRTLKPGGSDIHRGTSCDPRNSPL